MPDTSSVQILNALASQHRLEILICLRRAEMCVNELAEETALSQPALSRHLRQLLEAGLVTMRTEGKFHYFAIDQERAAPFLSLLLNHHEAGEDSEDSTREITYTWDLRTNEMLWVGNVDEAFGYEKGEFPRTVEAWEERIHPEDYRRVMRSVRRHLQGEIPFAERYRIRRKDGSYALWLDCGSVLPDASGAPYKWVGMTQEIKTEGENHERLG